jgi:hypothetical protein
MNPAPTTDNTSPSTMTNKNIHFAFLIKRVSALSSDKEGGLVKTNKCELK